MVDMEPLEDWSQVVGDAAMADFYRRCELPFADEPLDSLVNPQVDSGYSGAESGLDISGGCLP